MNRKMMKVFIGLIVICTFIGTVVAYGYGPSGYSGSSTSIQSSTSISMGSTMRVPFYPGGYSCYNNPQCAQAQPATCTQCAARTQTSCQQVCSQQCTQQPPVCQPVCTQECTPSAPVCTPVCRQQCTPVVQTGPSGGCLYGGCQDYAIGGGYCSSCCYSCSRYQSYNRYSFFANETEIEDVSGEWETDLFGPLYMKLTGDDILRAMYEVEGDKGYMQGDFTGNSTPNVVGIWFQEPTFEPFNNAGAFSMTFDFEGGTMEGIYAYTDGTWAPFTGEKVSMELTEDQDDALYNMPEYTGNISEELQTKVIDAPNPIDTNPLNAAAVEE